MESPRKKMVVEDEGGDGGESSESVVLQCTESEAVEQGEEVAMAESAPLPYTDRYGSLTVALQAYCEGAKLGAKEDDATEDVVNERKEVVSVRWVDRGRKMILTPRMASFQNEGGYWRTGVRRRCRARKSFMHGPFGVGASFVVDRAALKRHHEEVEQCSLEADESDDSASSSDSDASDSESEPWKRRDAKRRKGGEDDATGNESLQLSSEGTVKQPSLIAPEPIATQDEQEEEEEEEAPADYDDELKEMQELLELQLQAAEKREAGMKQRMEGMMDVLSRHMGHVEKRVSNLEEGAQPQEQVLERINVKLEKVMEGFSALNENLAILSACLSKNLESQ